MTEDDPHSPGHNGVSEYDVDTAMKASIGHILDSVPHNYAKYGPPPIESYLTAAEYSFKIGYAHGYRRAHADLTKE